MAAVRHLGFVKFEFFNGRSGWGQILHHRTKFYGDRSNRYGDIAIFVIFQDGGRRHFGFSEIRNFNGRSAVGGQYASLYQILSKSVKRLQRYSDLTVFHNGGRPPSWICWAPISTTHDDFLMVSIVVQNLVEIDAVVSITWNFQYFARLAWKHLFTPQNWGFRGISPPKWGAILTKPPNGTSLRESASFEPSSVTICRGAWPVGEFMKIGYK